MKRVIGLLCCITLFFSLSVSVFAEDFSVGIGVRGWYSGWNFSREESDNPVLLIGPSLKLQYGKFFTGISYLKSVSNYDFKESTGERFIIEDRNDIAIIIGYMLHPRFGLMIGYKLIQFFNKNVVSSDYFKNRMRGPAIGLTFNYPVSDTGLALFGNGSYLLLEYEELYGGFKKEANDFKGGSLDAGIAYGFSKNVSANLGYKYQLMTFKFDGVGGHHIISGPTFGLDYRF